MLKFKTRGDKMLFLNQSNRDTIRNNLSDVFDSTYSSVKIKINTAEDFYDKIYVPFKNGENLFYRGERINQRSRRMIPTLLRNQDELFEGDEDIVLKLDNDFLYDFYKTLQPFSDIYEKTMGKIEKDHMHDTLAFAQHYLDISPYIDLTKSLYVALSFAIKGREIVNDDIVLYTLYDIGENDSTTDKDIANQWINEYNVTLIKISENGQLAKEIMKKRKIHLQKPGNYTDFLKKLFEQSKHADFKNFLQSQAAVKKIEDIYMQITPDAKLIDVPTNDLMKYQQGVFLLLNNFAMVNSKYFTWNVRQSFEIKKYIISASLCEKILRLIEQDAPYYSYGNLLDISKALKEKRKN